MNVTELYALAEWFEYYNGELSRLYTVLLNTLTHNATQPNQQPVEEQLVALVSFLKLMRMGELSSQQIELLNELKVGSFLGPVGAQQITDIVKTATYDPATTVRKFNEATVAIRDSYTKLSAYATAVTGLGVGKKSFELENVQFVVRVGFKKEAAIDNIVEWKKSADDWLLIIRGLALSAGEAPENTKIVGVANGSLILVLAATCAVTALLARISKHISGISKDVLSVNNEMENLKQKKILTKIMEGEFSKLQKDKRENGLKAINQEVASATIGTTPISHEAKVALDKTIELLLKFGENGGDLDFVVTPDEEMPIDVADEAFAATQAEIEQVRKLVSEYQETRESIKLLENMANK